MYRETYAALKPKFGHWVIFDHCLPFDVTRAYDEATQYPRSAHLDRASATRRCGRRSKADDASAARCARALTAEPMKTYTNPVYRYRRAPDQLDARRRAASGRSSSAPGRSGSPRRSISRSAASRARARRRRHGVASARARSAIAKRTLEILDRLGCGEPRRRTRASAGTSARCSFRDELVYSFDLLPEAGHRRPAFVNLQQYYFEEYLVERARDAADARAALEEQGRRRRAAGRRRRR